MGSNIAWFSTAKKYRSKFYSGEVFVGNGPRKKSTIYRRRKGKPFFWNSKIRKKSEIPLMDGEIPDARPVYHYQPIMNTKTPSLRLCRMKPKKK